MRTCCGYQYDQLQRQYPPLDFHGPSQVHRTAQKCAALPVGKPSRQLNCFQGPSTVKKKRKLFPEPAPASPSSCPLPSTPHNWFRNLKRIPFRPENSHSRFYCVNIELRIDSPMVKHCSHGTFPHFSLQRSHLNICYYHQDLH